MIYCVNFLSSWGSNTSHLTLNNNKPINKTVDIYLVRTTVFVITIIRYVIGYCIFSCSRLFDVRRKILYSITDALSVDESVGFFYQTMTQELYICNHLRGTVLSVTQQDLIVNISKFHIQMTVFIVNMLYAL
jgi:hypothetical protein